MGIVHKLKPEVLNFILETKENDPSLSCRALTQLVLEKLQIKVSKSSVNSIFKEHNFSMPIGRRQKHKKKKFNMPVLPIIEGPKAVTIVSEPQKQPIKPEIVISEEKPKKEVTQEPKPEEISSEEKRVKEAEEWARKLHEEERLRIEEKLKLEKQKAEEENLKRKAQEAELRALLEEEARVKAQEDARIKAEAEKERLAKEAAEAEAEKKRIEEAAEAKRLEEERAVQEAAKLKRLEEEKAVKDREEAERRRLEEEAVAKAEAEKRRLEEETAKADAERKRLEEERLAKEAAEAKRLEEEKAAEEAALEAERERWAKLAEEEHKAKEKKEQETAPQKEEPAASAALNLEGECSGAIFLKALDHLIGGSSGINEIICKELKVAPEGFFSLTQAAIFKSLFGKDGLPSLCNLAGQSYSQDKLDSYYAQLKQLANIKPDIVNHISASFNEARGVKVHFIDGTIVYLDGQLHSTWSTPYIPYDFSSTVYELKNDLNKYFFEGHPLVLFSAPGYDVAPNDFFNMLLNFGSVDKYPDKLTLFGNKLEEVEIISLNEKNNYSMLFGLWPWQFTSNRKVKRIGEFELKHIDGLDKDIYLAEIEIDLLRATINQAVSLKGCAIKTNPAEKIRLVVLSNPQKQMSIDEMAQVYLSRWPNLEEAFHDFSRKIELFVYVSNAQKLFSKESSGADIEAPNLELDVIFEGYIKTLDAYLRWHFFPSGYTDKNFSFTSDNFYKLPVKLIPIKDKVIAKIQTEEGHQFLKDLEYLLRRFNERQIILPGGLRLCFENAFK